MSQEDSNDAARHPTFFIDVDNENFYTTIIKDGNLQVYKGYLKLPRTQ